MSPPQVQEDVLPTYTREEVAKHKKFTDCWVVVHGQVYDVSKWLPRHPGGARILMHYAGEDATVSSIFGCSRVDRLYVGHRVRGSQREAVLLQDGWGRIITLRILLFVAARVDQLSRE